MTNSNYELKIISRDQSSEGKVLKKYTIDGQESVGVVEGEPFQIQFKNKTWNKVQVRISVDGTDIQTGSLASTSSEGVMWLVEPYGTLDLKAWPETSNGGAEFLFSKVEDSVAANTHENMSGKGIIAAAVFIEGYSPYNFVNNGNYGQLGGFDQFRGNGFGQLVQSKNVISTNSLGIRRSRGPGGQSVGSSYSFNSSVANKALECNTSENISEDLAVGAGDFINQTIIKVAGLTEPKLDTTISVRYESWVSLRSKIRALQKIAVNQTNPAFPGDAPLTMIDLKKTPKGRKKPSRNPDLQRF